MLGYHWDSLVYIRTVSIACQRNHVGSTRVQLRRTLPGRGVGETVTNVNRREEELSPCPHRNSTIRVPDDRMALFFSLDRE